MQILPDWNVGIVAGAERRTNVALRFDEALQTTRGFSPAPGAGRYKHQPVGDDSESARTISVSIHIISSEFQGGGS